MVQTDGPQAARSLPPALCLPSTARLPLLLLLPCPRLQTNDPKTCELQRVRLATVRQRLGVGSGGPQALSIVAMLAGSDYAQGGAHGVGSGESGGHLWLAMPWLGQTLWWPCCLAQAVWRPCWLGRGLYAQVSRRGMWLALPWLAAALGHPWPRPREGSLLASRPGCFPPVMGRWKAMP